jgi:transcriptional regulator with PAS, ATPase and Fis domain
MFNLTIEIARYEILFIRRALITCYGNRAAAAVLLGIDRTVLYHRLAAAALIEDAETEACDRRS